VTECKFLAQVLQLAKLYGWKTFHCRPARTANSWRTPVQGDGKGFPDLVLVKGDRLLFAELKASKGRTTLEQDDWLAALGAVPGVSVHLWRPEDWGAILTQIVPSPGTGPRSGSASQDRAASL
jgi:hypothetical protein